MAEVPEQFKNNHLTLSKMKQFHSEGKYCDVQIRVNTKVFKCQCSLLAAHSAYFDTMFSSNFEESNTTTDQPITLQEMDATAFEELLRFMYVGEIRVRESNVLQLFVMNDFLQLSSGYVKERCLEYVKSRSKKDKPMSNALDFLCFAHLKGENVLVDTLRAHICRHLYHYYSKDVLQLLEISTEILSALLEFSKKCMLPLPGSADLLLEIVHKWINHNREGRSQYRSNLMEKIDFGRISFNFSRSLINGLENALDEVLNLSEDIKSLSVLKLLAVGIDTDLTDGGAQFDATISFDVKNVSEVKMGQKVFSSSCTICNLSWIIYIERHKDDNVKVFVCCTGTDLCSEWNCYASVIFTIKSQKEGRENFVFKFRRSMFSSDEDEASGWGREVFSNWNDLLDPENGFIKDDNSITIVAHVNTDVPFLKSGTDLK